MRYLILFFLSMFLSQSLTAQIYEVGVFAGGSNFIGDVGATNYISPNAPAFGGILKWNRSPRHSFRFSLIYTDLEADDRKSDDPRRKERAFAFSNGLLEASAGMEFTFFDFNLHESGTHFTPYLYSGVSVAKHDNFYFLSNGDIVEEGTSSWAFGIPITLGIKTNITSSFILALEVGARYTFSDELDGSVPDFDNDSTLGFGNTNSNDWYVFSGITLTYTFGQKPCYCNF
ncbi:DUF6089 family protein [Mangrovimonas sp. YM274]|uniref:type IX secretion system protein PorG n=1 Tax=Mangrovimonas sp. YM274 TaxID=3070660 RepID=UPI0027DCCE0F|nr:DUF6089 family protein [Mangrovimonas sp. YM274]WMI69434.1 DUF6089 family protein [Mangrovimonas sp. YM274]